MGEPTIGFCYLFLFFSLLLTTSLAYTTYTVTACSWNTG